MRFDARRLVSGRGLLVTVVAAGVLAGGGAATAVAASHDGGGPGAVPSGGASPTGGGAPGGRGTVDAAAAAEAALAVVPGKVEEIELDDDRGKAVWEIDVLANGGEWRDLTVDPGTGKVMSNRADRPDDDGDDDDGDGRDPAAKAAALRGAGVSAADAARAALKAVPGRVTSVDFERERGKTVWEVDVTDRDGVEHELDLDISSAEVLADEIGD